MYAVLSSRRGCSQVLFPGILSPHTYSITLGLQRGVGAKYLTAVKHTSGPKIVALRLHRYNSYIPYEQTLFLSTLMAGFAWDQPAV